MIELDENRKGRQRLRLVVSHLTEDDLTSPAGDGWSVAAILAHLAFWDFRVLHLLLRWKKEGIGCSPIDIDNVNDAMQPLLLALPGREAARLALQAAESVDAELENLPEEWMPAILELIKEGKFRLNRSLHRNEHLDQIERVFAGSREAGGNPSLVNEPAG